MPNSRWCVRTIDTTQTSCHFIILRSEKQRAFQDSIATNCDSSLDEIIKRPKPRIESLSDLIFGLALSIGAISLISRVPATPFRMLIDISEFGFSFLILISVWLGYTNIMSVLPLEDGTTVTLNLVLLFLVSIEPYLFYLNIIFDLSAHEVLLNYASILYALDMTGLMLILALFTHELAREERGWCRKIHSSGTSELGTPSSYRQPSSQSPSCQFSGLSNCWTTRYDSTSGSYHWSFHRSCA